MSRYALPGDRSIAGRIRGDFCDTQAADSGLALARPRACEKRLQAKMQKRDEMMLRINHLGGAKINFRKGADYSCRNQMLRIPLDYLSATETGRAIHRAGPPSQTDSVACDAASWCVPSADNPAEPRHARASDGGRSHFRRRKPVGPARPALGFGGVFFEPSAKLANALVGCLDISVDRLLQNKPEALEPVASLTRLQLNIANFLQELDDDDAIPSSASQPELFWRPGQGLFQFVLGSSVHACRSARTRLVQDTVESLSVAFADPVHNRLTTDAKQTADSRGFPAGQKEKQSSDSNSVPGTWNRLGFAQQGLPRKGRMR